MLKVGDARERDTIVGPLVTEARRDRVVAMIERGVAEGATVAVGGGAPDREGYFVNPTLDPRQKQGSYVKVNGRMGLGSDKWDIALIGKNLFNEAIFPYGNDTPLAGTFGVFSAWRFSEPGSSIALQGTLRF